MKPAINLFLATSTNCNVRCKTCPAGRKEPEPGGIMSLDMFNRILDKCCNEARVIGVQVYHYNEPTLLPHMADMIRECRSRNLPSFLSSNLVIWKNIPAIAAAGPDMFLVSVSGFTQDVYQRSHKDGNIDLVKENMIKLAAIKHPATNLQLSWHRYKYNEHEMPLMKEFAEAHGYLFAPYCTSLLPHDLALREWQTGIPSVAGEDLLIPASSVKDACFERRAHPCLEQDQILLVHGDGTYGNCCHRSDVTNIRGSLFDTTVPAILSSRKKDKACLSCKAVGGHIYAMQAYTRKNNSLLWHGEDIYRKLGLQGRFPRLTALAIKYLYASHRPQ